VNLILGGFLILNILIKLSGNMTEKESSGDADQDARMQRFEEEKAIKNKELEAVVNFLMN
jgi:hypothetical protein